MHILRRSLLSVSKKSTGDEFSSNSMGEYRLGVFSDVHLSKFYTAGRLRRAVRKTLTEKPDSILLLGDMIRGGQKKGEQDLRRVFSIIKEEVAGLPLYFVPGNHERAELSGDQVEKICGGEGVRLLLNSWAPLKPGRDESSWLLVGLDDFEKGSPDIGLSKSLRGHGKKILLATHNPDVLVARRDVIDYDLAIAGHLHGGEVRLPFLGPIVSRSKYPDELDYGWHSIGGKPVYITSGLGTVKSPIRIGARAEVCLLQLPAGKSTPEGD